MVQSVSRRSFLVSTVAGAAAFHVPPRRRQRHPVAVSSPNGRRAVEIAVRKMLEGVPPVDAAVLGIEPVENDPQDTSVGYGGLPDADGVVTLDACVMDGRSGLAGAVAALRNIKNPSQVALKVMRHTDHVLLVGDGALRFAKMHGFREEELLTDRARREWLRWVESHSKDDDWVSPEENGAFGTEYVRQTGTIHVGAVDANGDCGGATSTSGLAFKIPGRVGDSPLLGCGNYVDNEVGVAGSTGRGEAVIVTNGAHRVVGYMRDGMLPTDACLAALRDVVRFTKSSRLLDDRGRPAFQVNFYAVRKDGALGAAALYPSRHARMTEAGPEVVASAALFD
ncbi:MAG: N(4)-(beta-N-acetylglucosaminyl)-L-asparaginase [Planctomycetes bacterium]|nr:N(4)-(beta-N-acetylglucosaminyl)-L-asparaginase [Planctomycetota bacterium]